MTEVVYPPGCRPVTEDLGPDEMIRRLKVSYYLPKFTPKNFNDVFQIFYESCRIKGTVLLQLRGAVLFVAQTASNNQYKL